MSSRIAIFGVGPSGLAAAAAVVQSGREVDLFSKRLEKSNLYGCQYLHAPIPGYHSAGPIPVNYSLLGSSQDYRRKVYGDGWIGSVSPEELEGKHLAWDIRETYDAMWNDLIPRSEVRIRQETVTASFLRGHSWVLDSAYERVISTIPASYLCDQGHDFASHDIWAAGSTEPDSSLDAHVICDGTADVDWYRTASVFGYRTIEWSSKPSVDAAKVAKPLNTNCACFPNIIRMGRYGRWQKGILVHHVYEQTAYLMQLLDNNEMNSHICRTCGRWGERMGDTDGYYCQAGHGWYS